MSKLANCPHCPDGHMWWIILEDEPGQPARLARCDVCGCYGLPLGDQIKPGEKVRLREIIPALADRPDPLKVGMIGTVRETPHGSIGVEFDGHSDTGWNLGLHVIMQYVAPSLHIFGLCELMV